MREKDTISTMIIFPDVDVPSQFSAALTTVTLALTYHRFPVTNQRTSKWGVSGGSFMNGKAWIQECY